MAECIFFQQVDEYKKWTPHWIQHVAMWMNGQNANSIDRNGAHVKRSTRDEFNFRCLWKMWLWRLDESRMTIARNITQMNLDGSETKCGEYNACKYSRPLPTARFRVPTFIITIVGTSYRALGMTAFNRIGEQKNVLNRMVWIESIATMKTLSLVYS